MRLAHFFLALVMVNSGAAAAPDVQPPFERLPDGRIGVEIFGQKIGLPVTAADPDRDRIGFYLRWEQPADKYKTFKLRDALAEPDKARLGFEEEPVSVSIQIRGWPDSTTPALGRGDRQLLPSSEAGELLLITGGVLSITVSRSPEARPPKRGTLPDDWPPEDPNPDEDGYFVRSGVKSPRSLLPHNPADTGYRLPAAQRLWPASTDLVVTCRWTNAPVRKCRQYQQTEDGRIKITWGWVENTFHTPQGWYEIYFPKPRWKELDLRLHEVANYLLLNKPSGELE